MKLRLFFSILFIAFAVTSISAQPPSDAASTLTTTAAQLMPFDLHRYVEFNQYDTATVGQPPSVYRSSQTVFGTGLQFQGESNVAWVRDTSYRTSSPGSGQVSDLHFWANPAGDIQIFADNAMLNYVLPSSLASIFTPPNQWIDYFKLSAGVGNSYPITTLSGLYQGLTVVITFTGMYEGTQKVTVPRATFDTTYRFDISADVKIKLGTATLGSFTTTQAMWLAKGIGIIKMNMAHAGTTVLGQPVNVDGSERELTAYGIAATGSVAPESSGVVTVRGYPNPTFDQFTIEAPKPVSKVFLFSSNGEMVRSFEVAGRGVEVMLWLSDVPSGSYHARIAFSDGTDGEVSIVVRH